VNATGDRLWMKCMLSLPATKSTSHSCSRNILKNLKHDNIVRYHDRHVDRDAGILYILMEYCGGGDLMSVINQASKDNRQIPEDTIWNYLMQILRALCHCHHPRGHSKARSLDDDGKERRSQVLHRDLKPDNGT
jgi:NIMA (never in mitosis gene a)-related kinase 2